MFQNYFKIALRNLLRQKIYTFINIIGLTFGISCAILLFLYVQDELNFDSAHRQFDQIYRVTSHFKFNEKDDFPAATPGPLAAVMKKDYPEVIHVARFLPKGQTFFEFQEKRIYQKETAFVDSTWFDIFDYQFLQGNPQKALDNPNSIVLTQSIAEKLFDKASEAIGKTLRLDDEEKSYTVTAVIKDVPKNYNFHFSALISLNSVNPNQNGLNSWGNISSYTFALLKKGTDAKVLQEKMKPIFNKYAANGFRGLNLYADFKLQPLKEVHFSTNLNYDYGEKADIGYIYIFSAIAVFVLLIASINYMNLATARSANRAKEVGIRKVLGSYRGQLMRQFISESVLVTLIAFVLSLSLIELIMPFFNQLARKELTVGYIEHPANVLLFLLIVLILGVLSGLYPAFFLSNFNPVVVLKGKFSHNRQSAALRRVLVVVQFTISIVMIIGTWIVYQQLQYVSHKNLGFDKEQTWVVELEEKIRHKAQLIKDKLSQNPNIEGVAAASIAPGNNEQNIQGVMVEQGGEMKEFLTQTFFIDYDFLNVMGIELLKGRNFSKNSPSDTSKAFIINETFARKLGWKEPLNKKFLHLNDLDSLSQLKTAKPGRVVGVVKDFHLNSLHKPIEPLALMLNANLSYKRPSKLLVKVKTNQLPATLAMIEKTYQEFDSKHPYRAYFLDKNFEKQYESDQTKGMIFFSFSIFTIVIACLGLLGLASFTAEQKSKEIGIRKVLGASLANILYLVSKEFMLLILIAHFIGVIVAGVVMHKWLQDFAYRTTIWENWYIFVMGGGIAFLIALLTVIGQSLKAATTNPVQVLRNE